MSPIIAQQLQFVSDAGNKNFLVYAISIVSIAYLYLTGYKKESLLLIVATLSNLVSTALKFIFKTPRPTTADSYAFDIYGFPSSHTFMYTVLFGFLIYLSLKLTGIPLVIRTLAVFLSVYFIGLVGISRVYLGQHYAWDVVGGYLFGALFLAFIILCDRISIR